MMTAKQKLRSKADQLFKIACFEKYGIRCELCGETYLATVHHYYYRGSISHLRFDIDNGVILCGKHHFLLHHRDPKMIEEKIIKVRGIKWLRHLKKKAENPPKYFKFDDRFIKKSIKSLE